MKQNAEEFAAQEAEKEKKRKFMNQFRPENKYWNFIQDGSKEDYVEHVLRYNADPTKCYQDGRIERILENIEDIGRNLKSHEEAKWKLLQKHTLEIFSYL